MRGIGLMCGTSHDGLDIADVAFEKNENQWSFEVHATASIPLPESLKRRIDTPFSLSALEFVTLDRDFATFCATQVSAFIQNTGSGASFISSHGVTMFHVPAQCIACQLGSGAIISALTGLSVISDFRLQDVMKGGQGAPLVPGADRLLFADKQFTLNLGGFANVTDLRHTAPLGFDICACNLLLNRLVKRLGLAFDPQGENARRGKLVPDLLDALNALEYFRLSPPKSLGYEWFEQAVQPVLRDFEHLNTQDLLCTATEHIATQIARYLDDASAACLVTGGGAHNDFLLDRLKVHALSGIVKPSDELVDFREAIAFAFLGALRLSGIPNALASVTGARQDTCAGALYLP